MNQNFWDETLIYKCYAGSFAYGLDTPSSDKDIRGICIIPEEYLLGLKRFEQYEGSKKDLVIYGLQKFAKLAMQCNPNVIELLWVNDEHIIFMDEFGKGLRENRELFLSKRARFTFGGYAFAQLKKIKSHRKWVNNPAEKPRKEDFIKEKEIILEDGRKVKHTKFYEKKYDAAMLKYKQYLDWKRNRNPKRAELENNFGYDTKHAMHLVRLLKMGLEILIEGKVYVNRGSIDGPQLRAIRSGEWSYEKVIEFAEKYEILLDEAYVKSSLPHTVDFNKINELVINLTKRYWNEKMRK
ncbi:MAG: nucleotidyltransferase domain-containing protein [Promethearchaeota archaeon]